MNVVVRRMDRGIGETAFTPASMRLLFSREDGEPRPRYRARLMRAGQKHPDRCGRPRRGISGGARRSPRPWLVHLAPSTAGGEHKDGPSLARRPSVSGRNYRNPGIGARHSPSHHPAPGAGVVGGRPPAHNDIFFGLTLLRQSTSDVLGSMFSCHILPWLRRIVRWAAQSKSGLTSSLSLSPLSLTTLFTRPGTALPCSIRRHDNFPWKAGT